MNLVQAFVLVGWSVVAVALPSLAEAVDPKGQPLLAELGATLFHDHCASCHGVFGLGDGPAASSLKVPPADLTRIASKNGGTFPDADVASYIDGRFELDAHGTREMPIWGRRLAEPIAGGTGDEVARGQIQILVEYLKTIQQPAP
ncbi:MAG: cytochrome c [Myxococcales bacterium]|nr:cytochrome c [Myxococcales bacterium]